MSSGCPVLLRWSAAVLPLLFSAPPALGQIQLMEEEPFLLPTAPYNVLDNNEGSRVNLNFPTVRNMALDADGLLYVANAHDSTVEVFDTAVGAAVRTIAVPWGPVSLALWKAPGATAADLLVVCRGNYCLARIDLRTDQIRSTLALPAEPGDLLVGVNQAWITCTAVNAVVQVDLVGNLIQLTYDETSFPAFRCMEPLHLAFDDQKRILVAPLISGNNTSAARIGALRAGGKILDLSDPGNAAVGLPDEDLFRIDPTAGAETVEVVGKATGTILFGLAWHSNNAEVWQLNTDAVNADPALQTEPEIRGIFSKNRVSRIKPATNPVATPHAIHDLDRASTGGLGTIDPNLTVGQPVSIAIASNGLAYITGLLTDNVLVLTASGAFQTEWDLPAGSIPRYVMLNKAQDRVLVYCWGSNEVRTFDKVGNPQQVLALNHDPTPPAVQTGRQLFYDASKSLNNNLSCATCHVEGKSDLLAWNLSAGPVDSKGPMMTQTLVGIEKVKPFHWRGERADLIDFNGAFDGLLGGQELDEVTEFAFFQDFVFSLAGAANPYQDDRRLLNNNIDPPVLNPGAGDAFAVNGQTAWFNTVTFGSHTCNECHSMPTGTDSDIFPDDVVHPKPKRARFKVASFQDFWRRFFQSTWDAQIYNVPGDPSSGFESEPRAYLGAGVSHAGLVKDLLTFVGAVGQTGTVPQLQNDITAFAFQFDNSLAPAVHKCYLLTSLSSSLVASQLSTYLLPQANARNCDVAVLGIWDDGLTPVRAMRWFFDRAPQLFVPEDPTVPSWQLADFIAATAQQSFTFLGLPTGMGERWAVDYDLDGLYNAADANPYTPDPASDTTDPLFTLNPQLRWNNARIARIGFETDEPTTYSITHTNNVGAPAQPPVTTSVFSKVHAPLVTHLLPSTATGNSIIPAVDIQYTVTVTVTDRNNNSSSFVMQPFGTLPFIDDGARRSDHVVGSMNWTQENFSGSTFSGRAEIFIDHKYGGPPAVPAQDRIVVCSVLVDGVRTADVLPVGQRTFLADVIQAVHMPSGSSSTLGINGPFLVSGNTGANGKTALKFDVLNVAAGQTVTLNVEAVIEIDPAFQSTFAQDIVATNDCVLNGTNPDWDCDGNGVNECCVLNLPVTTGSPARSITKYSFPDTLPANRAITSDL